MAPKILTRKRSKKSILPEVLIPSQFRSSISQELTKDAVTKTTGISYDRQSIETWIETGQVTSPLTKCPVANQIPPPRVSLTTSDFSAVLSEFSLSTQTGNLPQCILLAGKIRSLAKESEKNKRCLLSNGAAAALTAAFLRFPAEETLAALTVAFPLDDLFLTRLSAQETLLYLVNIIENGSRAARICAVRLLKDLVQSDVAVAAKAAMVNGMAEALVNLLRDPVSEQAFRASLVAIFYMASSKEEIAAKYARLGLVPLLLDALVDCEKSTTEKITAVLDVICDSRIGKLTVYEHALAVPLLVKKILRVSVITTEFSVSVLWKLCKRDGEEEGENSSRAERSKAEALEVGAFQKLLLLLQVGCGDATKEKASALLKLLNGPRKSSDCADSADFKSVKRPL